MTPEVFNETNQGSHTVEKCKGIFDKHIYFEYFYQRRPSLFLITED